MPSEARSTTRDEVRARLLTIICDITRTDLARARELPDDTPCVGGDLLRDSLDVLEFVVALQREFGLAIRDGDAGREILTNLGTVTDHVMASRA